MNFGPLYLWNEPWEGLPGEEAAWIWDLIDTFENGPTKNPPDHRRGWKRWYFTYRTPDGSTVRISADLDPVEKKWFNPHRSSED